MISQTDKSCRNDRALNQNWLYQPILAGRAIGLSKQCRPRSDYSKGKKVILTREEEGKMKEELVEQHGNGNGNGNGPTFWRSKSATHKEITSKSD